MNALDSLVRLIVCGFAAWRVARMVAGEDGPFDLFVKLRAWTDSLPAKRSKPDAFGGVSSTPHWIQRGVNCVLCVSFWTSLAAVLLLPPLGVHLNELAVAWLSVAGIAIIINTRSLR